MTLGCVTAGQEPSETCGNVSGVSRANPAYSLIRARLHDKRMTKSGPQPNVMLPSSSCHTTVIRQSSHDHDDLHHDRTAGTIKGTDGRALVRARRGGGACAAP